MNPTSMNPSRIVAYAFLRGVLKLDAGLSAATALLFTAGGSALAAAVGVPAALLLAIGLTLIPWIALLLWVATRTVMPVPLVWVVIGLNALWALDCALVALGIGLAPTAAGVGLAAVQAAGAALLAALEWVGLRRPAPLAV